MKLFMNRGIRRLFIAAGLFLLAAIITGQVLVWQAVNDYKTALIAHDAALAGKLVRQGLDPAAAAAVFTSPKTEADQSAGRLALERAGIRQETEYWFVPEAEFFLRRYGPITLITGVMLSAAALALLFIFFTHQERQVERARLMIEQFMQTGEHGSGQAVPGLIEGSLDEGSLAQLFNAINGMASSLTAHLQKEQHDREFLKDTISDISHQLKTPLAALTMYTEIIRDERTANPVVSDFIRRSEQELSKMEYLIQNLLKLARLDAGAITLEKRLLALPAFLEDTLECFAVRAATEAKKIRLQCPPALTLDGDDLWLAEAVSNLVKNGLDHTTAGGEVQVICEETPLTVSINVQDNGTGIHPEDLPYVFKRFYRSRFSQDQQGVGIGLSLAQTIVEKHGGSIIVESEMGRGSVFRMIFPKLTNM